VEICITARHGSISDDAFSMIQQKVEKLARFYDRVSSIEVMIDLPRKGESGVEMKLCADKANDFFARGTGHNVLSAVESVVQKLEQQLRKYKERLLNRSRTRDAGVGVIEAA
jgi:putative sigma-54 modulation protein